MKHPKQNHKTPGHTPGPWHISGDDRCIYAKLTTVDGTAVEPLVAQCSKHTTSANANARLIAASPELLAALKDMIQAFEVVQTRRDYYPYQQALALIDRIEGSSNE